MFISGLLQLRVVFTRNSFSCRNCEWWFTQGNMSLKQQTHRYECQPSCFIRSLSNQGLDNSINKFISKLLNKRTIISNIGSTTAVNRGTRQGGVLSFLLWNIHYLQGWILWDSKLLSMMNTLI